MSRKIKTLLTLAALLLVGQFSIAGSIDSLTKAIQRGNEEKAISLIAGTDLNALDKDGNTALAGSAAFYAKVTKALIDAKADVNLPTKVGITPLFNACRWGNAEIVKMLIDAGADVNKETQLGNALMMSFYYSSAPIIKMLLDAGAKFKEPVKIMNTITVYPFLQYIRTVKTPAEMMAYYLASKEAWLKLPVKFPDRVLNPKESDFSPAADVVKVFIDKGLDVNQVYENNKVKETAIEVAMQSGLTEAAKVMIDAGAKYDIAKEIKIQDRWANANALFPGLTYNNGDYVLGAVLSNNIDFVKLMVDKHPKLVTKSYEGKGSMKCSNNKTAGYNVKGIDLLMVAAEHGNAEIVKYLIEKGAGRGKMVEAKWDMGHSKTDFCPLLLFAWTMRFAKNSHNQQVIDLVKAAGHVKE